MVRAMYSGVAGMKSHQTRLDVIGNNIANVNTYGFKSSRATFRDMYYQQLRGASGGTTTRGGTNPSMVGYGSQVASVDLLMTQSTMSPTGNPLDVCITGEGFLQVMDPDGNIFYTKAGMLDIDPASGAVVDSNGNFVLGTSAADNQLDSTNPASSKIIIKVDSVKENAAQVETEVGGRTLTITSSAKDRAANVSFTFTTGKDMPINQKVQAVMTPGSTNINIQLNPQARFASINELNTLINNAITDANGGPHAGGDFTLNLSPDPFADGAGLTGEQIIGSAGKTELGEIGLTGLTGGAFWGGFSVSGVGSAFSGNGAVAFTMERNDTDDGYVLKATVTANPDDPDATDATYTATLLDADMESGSTIRLERDAADGADANDTITLKYPEKVAVPPDPADWTEVTGTATPSRPSQNLGLGDTFTLTGGTAFTEQGVNNLSGISIGANGIIMGTSAAGQQVLGRIDLATFGNSKGLMQSGNSYFTSTANSGDPKLAIPGEDGTGALKNSALETSNVDLSQEFSDMITTQRGFQANSRLITVSDTMLEELINLKR